MIIKTQSGQLKGYYENGLYLFKGVPYAHAKRFQAPVQSTWQGVLDCTEFKDKVAQLKDDGNVEGSEDGLNLNIYTPLLDQSLPVLVEIHGGAFQSGSNQKMDPYHVIKDKQFIYITINYRLGVLGYLYLGKEYPTSGNNGTLDQLMALKWIHENIENFGGDSKRVTLLGSSAGAKSIGALMSIPETKTYFQQVILVSGAAQSVRDEDTAHIITERYKKIMAIDHVDALVEMPLEKIMKGQKELCKGFGSTCLFGPVADGQVIPYNYFEYIASSSYWSGRIIIGSSKHEFVFVKMMGLDLKEHGEMMVNELFGVNGSIAIEDQHALAKTMSNDDAWVKVISDYMYRTYSYRLANTMNKNGSTVWLYSTEFLPACHCMDHILSFEPRIKLDKYFNGVEDKSEIIELGNIIQNAYIHFVIHQEPGIKEWQPLNIKDCQMIWDQPIHVESAKEVYCDRFPNQVYRLK